MVLRQIVVQRAVGPVGHPLPEDIPHGPRLGIMAIRGEPAGRHVGHRPRGTEERLGCCEVSGVTGPRIDEVAVAVDGTVEIAPPSVHVDGGLIDVPTVGHCTTALRAQRLAQKRGELALPVPHGFMGEHEATLEKHRRPVPQTQLRAEAPQDAETDHIGWILQPMEGRPGPFVQLPLAGTAAEAALSALGAIGTFGDRGRLTVRACPAAFSLRRRESTRPVTDNQDGVRSDRTLGGTPILHGQSSDEENALTGNRARRAWKNYGILSLWTHASTNSHRKPSTGSRRKPKPKGSLSTPISTCSWGFLNEGTALAAMSEAEFEAFIEDFSKGSEHFPPLPPDFSRADIYTDHD